MRWEYLVKDISIVYDVDFGLEFGLNCYGEQGWELVAVQEKDVIFKRLVEESKDFEAKVVSKILSILREQAT